MKMLIFFAIVLSTSIGSVITAEPVEDKQILINFIQSISHSRSINWNMNSEACDNWTGITCNHDGSRIIALRLPAFSLHGPVPPNTLSQLTGLQILSLRSNGLTGPFPVDFANLRNLTALYLQSNEFYGPLPSDFSTWNNLSILDLSNNGFNGSIPFSVRDLSHLTALNLANNSFTGEIPDLDLPSLQTLDVSNNDLSGPVPRSLERFPSSVFAGNDLVALNSTPTGVTNSSDSSSRNGLQKKGARLTESAILGIAIGGCALAFGLLALVMVFRYSKDKKEVLERSDRDDKPKVTKLRSGSQNVNGNGNLVFFEGSSLAFDLEDLFRASAEVLGKGTFGTTYKAALEDASTVVVKRLKEVGAAKRDFEVQMELVGNIRHENVVTLRAYYYSKDEKLMVYDYFDQGSVSSLLHGMGIRVTLKPEFRITPPPQMSPHMGEIPQSTFQFDFELERKILAEAEKENPNWSKLGLENLPHKPSKPISRANSSGSVDPVVGKYMSTGLDRDAVSIAVAKYGDNPVKVREFVNGYVVLREMGFEANSVAEALFTHDNDKEAAAHFLTTSS